MKKKYQTLMLNIEFMDEADVIRTSENFVVIPDWFKDGSKGGDEWEGN